MSLVNVSNIQENIKEWTDCWFGPTKRTGYIAVTDLNRHKFYGAKDINALISDTKDVEKCFISLNAFTFGSRESANLKQIRNIGIDIDQYKLGLTIEETLDEIQALILDKIIPEPNLILTSRGVQLFYTIKDGAAPNMSYLVSYITDQFIGKLKFIGADSNAKDLSRVMRVPNSINERNGKLVEATVWCDEEYTLQHLQTFCKPLEQFETRKRKKSNLVRFIPKNQDQQLSSLHLTNYVRLIDLEKLISIRKGDLTGKRNIFLYVYAYHQSLISSSFADLEVFLYDVLNRIHSKTDKPIKKAEFRRTIKSAYEDAREFFDHFKANGYKIIYKANDGIKKPYKTSNLIDILEVSENEQRQLRRLVGSVVAKEKDKERKCKERRAAGVQSVDEYNSKRKQSVENKLDVLKKLMDNGLTKNEIAMEMSISPDYVKKLKRQLKGK